MKIHKLLTVAITAALLGACNTKALDDLEGVYPAPTDITFTSAVGAEPQKAGRLKVFPVDFKTADGGVLHMEMVGDSYFLPAAAFTPEPEATAKKGNYIAGKSVYTQGGSTMVVSRGIITVEKVGDDYSTSGTLWLEGGSIIRVHGGGTIVYEPTDPMQRPERKGAQVNYDGTITAVFSTGGYTETFDMTTYQMVYEGEGYEWQVVIKSPDGKLYPGTYAPGDGYVVGHVEQVDYGFGPMDVDAGTIWYTIADGKKVPTYITAGDIVVAKDGPVYTVDINQGKEGVFAQYEGPVPALDPEGSELVTFTKLLAANSYAQYGMPILDVLLSTDELSFDPTTYQYAGSGSMVQLEIYSADGSIAAGDYTIATKDDSSDFVEGTFRAGDDGMFGLSGTFANTYTDGVPGDAEKVTDGRLSIKVDGTNYTFTLVAGKKVYKASVEIK